MKEEIPSVLSDIGERVAEIEMHIASVETSAKEAMEKLAQISDWCSWARRRTNSSKSS